MNRKPTAVILALHGLNEHAGIFDGLKDYLMSQDIYIHAYTQRGFGDTPERNRWVGLEALCEDVETQLKALETKFPDVPLFLLGHSLGGTIALHAIMQFQVLNIRLAGMILLAPAVARPQDHAVPFGFKISQFLARHVPKMKFPVKWFQILASDNRRELRQRARDPLIIHWPRVEVIAGTVRAMAQSFKALPLLTLPVLYVHGGKERIVPPRGVKNFLEQLSTRDVDLTVHHEPRGYHFLIRDLCAPQIMHAIEKWVKERL